MSRIQDLTSGLMYMSETDAPFEILSDGKVSAISIDSVLERFGDDRSHPDAEEVGFDEFFDRLICERDWYGEREIDRAKRFASLRDALKENLTDLKVYRVGKVQIDIYIVGLDRERVLVGIITKAVET